MRMHLRTNSIDCRLTKCTPLAASVAMLSVVIGLAISPGVARANPPVGYCSESVFENLLAPLDHFPSTGGFSFSQSGQLRVGPKVLRIYPPRNPLVVVGRDHFEARGALAKAPKATVGKLNWWVQSSLERVGARGSESKIVRSMRQYVGVVREFGGRDFGFAGRVKPGIYRLRLRIEGSSGQVLTQYHEYYRAVPDRQQLKLTVEPTAVAPGGTTSLRVENHGTVAGTYRFRYRIWRVGGEELSLPPQIYGAYKPRLAPGHASPCIRVQIPIDAPAGDYRIGIEGKASLSSPRESLATRLTIRSQ
jgi:hypothetical protein